MDDNFQDDYLLLEGNRDSFNLKIKRQKKRVIFFLLCIWILIILYIINGDTIDKLLNNDITITSKDWTQKMSLMKNNVKYHGSNSCPKWYHIPTAYERRKLWKLWCENEEICDVNYIWFDSDDIVGTTFYWSERSWSLSKFFNDSNIHLDKRGNFYAWFYHEQKLWIKNNNSYCNALTFLDSRGLVVVKVYWFDLYDCEKPKYVRCFSDENLTPEFIYEEKFSSKFSIEYTKFEIDGTIYSWRKVTSMPRWDVVIPDSFEWIPIVEIWEWLYGDITSVKLGENMIKIDNDAFASNWIKEIEFPNSVLYIWDHAFLNNQLTSVKFPDNLFYIWGHAFDHNQLTSIKLPDTVKFIGTWAFWGNKITSFKIPNWIKEISPEILRNNNLEIIEIPEWVETIWDLAFYGNNLKEISLPQSLKTIWKSAFSCNNLTEILLPKSIEIIWNLAFCWNETGRESDLKGVYCGENGYVKVKWYPKDRDACININSFKSCRDEEDNWVCWKKWWSYRNPCHMKAYWDEENPDYEFIDWKCVHK